MHLLLHTHESPCLSEDPGIRISCANTSCVITSSVQSNLFLLTIHYTGHYHKLLLIRVCQSVGKGG